MFAEQDLGERDKMSDSVKTNLNELQNCKLWMFDHVLKGHGREKK